jgi:phosphoribosyl-dephospho-CoA transferase
VVVRRTAAEGHWIAVGVRGIERHQRWAAWVAEDEVVGRLKPEALTARLASLSPERLSAAPALAAAATLDAVWCDEASPPIWGPTGSVGFELASGRPTATAASDLDAILRCPSRVPLAQAQGWLAVFAKAAAPRGVRTDVLLETPSGAVALLDYARARTPVMLRTAAGPRLEQDPWAHVSVSA